MNKLDKVIIPLLFVVSVLIGIIGYKVNTAHFNEPAVVVVEEVEQTLYERVGGAPAISAAVDNFYVKVMADPLVNHFFEDVSMRRQHKRQKQFLTMALGGPNNYEGRSMKKVHKGMNIEVKHFVAIAGHLTNTLLELDVHPLLVAEIIAVVATTQGDIVGQ